jgi:hypothetical protein
VLRSAPCYHFTRTDRKNGIVQARCRWSSEVPCRYWPLSMSPVWLSLSSVFVVCLPLSVSLAHLPQHLPVSRRLQRCMCLDTKWKRASPWNVPEALPPSGYRQVPYDGVSGSLRKPNADPCNQCHSPWFVPVYESIGEDCSAQDWRQPR